MSASILSCRVLAVSLSGALSLSGLLLTTSPLLAGSGAAFTLAALDRKDAAGVVPDVPWSAVVRDIQRELRDLGLYNGPMDGLYSAEVRAAIDRFERLHGKIGEGQPLTDALRSIVSVRDALKLRRNLDEIRERQTDAALQALRANPETRDLVDGKRTQRRVTPPQSADCNTAVTVDCLLAAARKDAAGVTEINFHDWAMREIILTEIRTGRGSDAVRERLRQLSDPRLVLVAMREVSEALAQDGRVSDGLALAETIPDEENRIRAVASIAVSASRQGDAKRARALSQRATDALHRNPGLSARMAIATSLASGLAQGGDIDAAKDVLRAARKFASPASTRLLRHAEVGLLTGIREDEESYGDAASALTAFVASSAGSVAQAADTEDKRYRVTTLCNLAVIQAKAGNMEAAAAAAEKAHDAASRLRKGYPQDYAWFSVALTQGRIGRPDVVESILENIRNEQLRAEGYWRAAEIAAETGRRDMARNLEGRALAIAMALDNGFERSIMLGDLATAAARVGRDDAARRIFDDALRAGQALDAGWWRARAFARLATALHFVAPETRP